MLVLLALCVIFLILPESKTRTNESRGDEFKADWVVELDWVGTALFHLGKFRYMGAYLG